jgi:hypothetical protein
MCYTLYVRKKGAGFEMTFAVYCDEHASWIDIETLDELTWLAERYGWRKWIVDIKNMTIQILDDETEGK